MSSDTYKPEYIRLDLFPAIVETESTSVGERKVIVTNDKVLIYTNTPQGPEEEERHDLYDFSGDRKSGWTILTEDQQEIKITKDKGCGCGSRLRGHHPFLYTPYKRT